MKWNKKKVFTLALAVCLIAILSMGSLAWFTDSEQIDNEFMIAGSESGNADDVFSVDVWENTPAGDKDQDGHKYENILPGDTLKKEVHVENTGSYSQYIRVVVVVSNAAQWQEVLGLKADEVPALDKIVDGFVAADWERVLSNLDNGTFWYVLYAKDTLDAGKNIQVFSAVKIPDSLTREQAAAFMGGFKIGVVAHAVQTEHVGDTAFEAFAKVGPSAVEDYNEVLKKWKNS